MSLRRSPASVAGVFAFGLLATAPSTASPPRTAAAPAPATPASPAPASSSWCAEGLEVLDDETCFVPPDPARGASSLLIYLHGVLPPGPRGPDADRVQRIVLRAARRAGYGALVPRGVAGIGPGALKAWWAWPTSSSAYAAHAAPLVASWLRSRQALEAKLGAPFAHTYLAGSSSGAYFVVALALHGAIEVDGFGAMSGGTALAVPRGGALAKRPFYVGYGTLDPTRTDPERLTAQLRALGWPFAQRTHPLPHGAAEAYLDDAFAYWGAAAAGL